MDYEKGQRFLAKLSALRHELPFSPDVFRTLFLQTGNGSYASINDIAETISKDQGLSARILTTANSAFYGLQNQVSSVSRAAAVLGVKEIKNIVLALGVHGLASQLPPKADFSMEEYWHHQFQVAATARNLASNVGAEPDTAFTCGLLHDVGKLITAIHSWDDHIGITELIAEKKLMPSQAEDLYWGLDHGVVGSLVLRSWKLPEQLSEPVNWHHNPELAEDFRTEAQLICLADSLIHSSHGNTSASGICDTLIDALKLDSETAFQAALNAIADEDVTHFISSLAV